MFSRAARRFEVPDRTCRSRRKKLQAGGTSPPVFFFSLPGRCVRDKSLRAFSTVKRELLVKFFSSVCKTQSCDADSQFTPQSPTEMARGRESKRKGRAMTKQEERRAQEREEIVARIAKFRATQAKFERERDEYFRTTMQNARKTERPSF
jgi:hypothetical protein